MGGKKRESSLQYQQRQAIRQAQAEKNKKEMSSGNDASYGATEKQKPVSKAVPPKKNIFGNIKKTQPQTEAQKRSAASHAGQNYVPKKIKGNGVIGRSENSWSGDGRACSKGKCAPKK